MNEDAKWQAVMARDASCDGAFVYAVATTGIFCRPSCASRRPKHENVRFFNLPDAASAAGFRACLRCRPERAKTTDPVVERVQRMCRCIEQGLAESDDGAPTLAQLAAQIGGSPHHLQRTFRRLMGITPAQYADARRLQRVKARLKAGDDVTGALYEAGYGAVSRLYERAPHQLGMTPATYARGGKGARIAFATAQSPLGRLLVAATERGVCFLSLGDDDKTLTAALRSEFPAAEIVEDAATLADWLNAVISYLDGKTPHPQLPLDVRATAFQRRVWEELIKIPPGFTRSYTEIAETLGNPGARRAVARACATNPVSLIIPCHRVIRGDGALGGYRWGLERKQALIATERRHNAKALADAAE